MTHFYKNKRLTISLRSLFTSCLLMIITLLASVTVSAQDLYFSEYIEGSGNSKAFEIYNPTGAEVDLGSYLVLGNFNGNPFNDTLRFPAGTMLSAGDVFVVAHESADSLVTAAADSLIEDPFGAGTSFITVFNGDDVRGLFKIGTSDTTLIDIIGVDQVDPGSAWAVAGVSGGTRDHTLLRKASITSGNIDFLAGAGTNADDSEWIVLEQNDFSNIGQATPPFFQPEPPYEVGDNIVGNGSFEAFMLGAATNSLNWAFNKDAGGANAAFEMVNGSQDSDSVALKVDFGTFNGGSDDWNVEAVNEPFNVVEGETYRSSVWIKADTDARVANLYFNLPASGGWARYEQSKVTLSTEWTQYTQVHTASAADVANTMRYSTSLNFVENDGGTIWIDNLTITRLEDPVKVTFNVNTATMPDTLMENHVIQVRGGTVGPDKSGTGLGSMITWDSASLVTDNVGGDYWSITFDMSRGDTLNYKFWAGIDTATPLINGSEQGWESGDNNQFILPMNAPADTTLPLQWFETRSAPFTTEADSITVFFRVNVGALIQTEEFDPETDKVGVRGNGAFFTTDWGTGDFLSRGAENGNNLFYEGIVRSQKDSVASIDGSINYKFVIEGADGNVTWESTPDRPVTLPAADSTLHWVFFNDTPPSNATIVDTQLNFEVNVGILEGLGFFNSSFDTVFVRGTFNSWSSDNQMNFSDVSGNYEGLNIPFKAAEETQVAYKYYVKWDASRDDEESANYLSGITHDGSGWEEPGVTGGADRTFTITSDATQETRSEFYNGVEPQALLTPGNVNGGAISVTFSVDMAPAVNNVAQPFLPASDSVFLFVDTPFFALTNGLTVPGDGGENFITATADERERLRFTDDDNDMVYTLELDLTLPTLNHIGFRIAYGEPTSETGSLFANGGGFAAGRRHYQYIQPMVVPDGDDLDELPDVSWPSTYTAPTLTWAASDLPFELPPNYLAVANEGEVDVANKFSLEQNYPNPFNPSTNISFSLPNAANVNLTVYNLLGQKVATLINGKTMTSGSHSVSFNASSLSSGVYLYRLEAGSFVSNKRMTLIK